MDQYPTEARRAEAPADRAAPAPPPPARSASRKFWAQVVFPLALFVALVGGITYLRYNTPHTSDVGGDVGVAGPGRGLLTFPQTRAAWDPSDPDFVGEFELHTPGHATYRFENQSGQTADLGIEKMNCTCSQVTVCLLEPSEVPAVQAAEQVAHELRAHAAAPGAPGQGGLLHLLGLALGGTDGLGGVTGQALDGRWKVLDPDRPRDVGLVVPPGRAGLARLYWNGHRTATGGVRLAAGLWDTPHGKDGPKRVTELTVPVTYVPPLRTSPESLKLEDWDGRGVARTSFVCWSSTRTHFPLRARIRNGDPCLDVEVVPLTGSDCQVLEGKLRNELAEPPHVLSGYRVRVTGHQEKGSRQLEHGQFQRWVDLFSSADPDIPSVRLRGVIRGDLVVGDDKDSGVLRVGSYPRSQSRRKTIAVWTNPGVELLPDKVEKTPDFLQVKLDRVAGAAVGQTGWRLRVTIPANPPVTGWPDDSAVILHVVKTTDQGRQERRIRIPVLANPFQ